MTQTDTLPTAKQILRDAACKLLTAIENLDVPKTFAEIAKAARAVMAADRMINQLFDMVRVKARTAKSEAAPPAPAAPVVEEEEVTLNRQQRRRAEAMLRKLGLPAG